jgi:phage protein D
MLAPKFSMNIGSESFSSDHSDAVEVVHVNLSLNVPTDSATILLRDNDQSYDFNEGDEVDISLAYDDQDETKVFTGTVGSIRSTRYNVKVTAFSPMRKLVNYFLNNVYVSQNCGQIVSDLVKSASVESDTISPGIDLPTYTVDGNNSAYDHIRALADRCGFDVYVSPDGKLEFKKFEKGDASVAAEYGVDVIKIQSDKDHKAVQSVTILGESPSSTKGSSATSWLTKDIVYGTAGDGQSLVLTDPVIRDKSTASNVATAKLAMIESGPSIMVEMIGTPGALLGSTLTVKSMPDSDLNTDYKITSVEHIFDKNQGFKSNIGCVKV